MVPFFSALCSNSEYRFQSHFLHRYLLVPKSQKGAKFVGGLRGPGGLHQDFLEIDFLVVSDREE